MAALLCGAAAALLPPSAAAAAAPLQPLASTGGATPAAVAAARAALGSDDDVASGAVSRAFFAGGAFALLADALLCGAPLPRALLTRQLAGHRALKRPLLFGSGRAGLAAATSGGLAAVA